MKKSIPISPYNVLSNSAAFVALSLLGSIPIISCGYLGIP